MASEIPLYAASAILVIWGLSHLAFGTRGVVDGFGDISRDNRRVITMEWIAEGIALIAIAAFVTVATILDTAASVATGVYAVAIVTLVVMAVVSLFTGFRIAYLPYRLCPAIFGLAAILIGAGAWL